jgi:hypothetical protein
LEGQRPEGELGRHGQEAYNNGFDVVRIISRDGNYFPVTRDYREDRINFNIEDTLVVQASVG